MSAFSYWLLILEKTGKSIILESSENEIFLFVLKCDHFLVQHMILNSQKFSSAKFSDSLTFLWKDQAKEMGHVDRQTYCLNIQAT